MVTNTNAIIINKVQSLPNSLEHTPNYLQCLQDFNVSQEQNNFAVRKVEWNEELEAEYQAVMKIMQNQIRLSPYDPTKKLRLDFF